MKKLAVLLVLTALAPCVFAQPAVTKAVLERKTVAAQDAHAKKVAALKKDLTSAVASFQRDALKMKYYQYGFIFQSMDGVRESYMALRSVSLQAAQAEAFTVNAPVKINNGKMEILIEDFIRMESINLPESEQVKFDAFGEALAKDLQSGVAQAALSRRVFPLKNELAKEVELFAANVYKKNYYDYNQVFYELDKVAQAYLALRAVSVEAARSEARFVNKDILLANGKMKIRIADYVRMEACTLYESEQAKMNAFSDILEQDLQKK